MRSLLATLAALAAMTAASSAAALEARTGALEHNSAILGDASAGRESGVTVQLELSGDRKLVFGGSPFVLASLIEEGASFMATGLEWKRSSGRFFVAPALGYAVHDGRTTRGAPGTLRLGSRDLFYLRADFGMRVGRCVSAAFRLEHLSHGQMLGRGVNNGLDNVGLRFGRSLQCRDTF